MKKTLTAISALATIALFASWSTLPQDSHQDEISEILRQLYEDDQAARQGWGSRMNITPEEIAEIHRGDERRRDEVLAILADGMLKTGDDHFHAAMILQHGGEPDDYLLSHILATIGGFEGNESSRWLAAASLDRYLQSIDRPQIFGTQSRRNSGEEEWTQEPIHAELIHNKTRARYGVPAIAETNK